MPDEEKELEAKEEEKGKEELDLDQVDIDLGEKQTEEVKIEQEKKEKEKKEEKPPEPTAKEKEMEERLTRLESDKKNLQKALHEARQERKKTKEPESQVSLSDAELMKIVEEHKDDPKVMFNALTYKVQQLMKSGKVEAVNEVEIKNKQKEVNALLVERIKDLTEEGSQSRGLIDQAKKDFFLEDHPLSDFLGASAAVYVALPQLLQKAFEDGKKTTMDEKAEEERKKGIKERQPGPGGTKTPDKGTSGNLTPSQLETAKRLGFTTPEKLRLYQTQILKTTNA